jgi:hypothetical protein
VRRVLLAPSRGAAWRPCTRRRDGRLMSAQTGMLPIMDKEINYFRGLTPAHEPVHGWEGIPFQNRPRGMGRTPSRVPFNGSEASRLAAELQTLIASLSTASAESPASSPSKARSFTSMPTGGERLIVRLPF